jgi:hypothetical protein
LHKGQLTEYPVKILLAFGESIDGNDKLFMWLLKNGYPELAALAKAIRGSEEAFDWLMKNDPHFRNIDQLESDLRTREEVFIGNTYRGMIEYVLGLTDEQRADLLA